MNWDELPQEPGECLELNTRDKHCNQIIRETVIKLKNTIKEIGLLGLSAPSIGIKERIICLNFGKDIIKTMINPVPVRGGDVRLSRESCIHLPGKEFLVPRHHEIEICYETPLGQIEQVKLIGKAACVFQQCNDILNGMWIDEIGFEIDKDWDDMSDDDKAEIIKEWLDSIDTRVQDLNEELKNSKEANKLMDAVEFDQALARGEITLKEEKHKIVMKEENNGQDTVEQGNNKPD